MSESDASVHERLGAFEARWNDERSAHAETRAALEGARSRVSELEGSAAEVESLRAKVAELESLRAKVAELEADASRVPGAGGGRVPVDTSALSAGDKIRFGLDARRSGG
jgi:hypothetical protein